MKKTVCFLIIGWLLYPAISFSQEFMDPLEEKVSPVSVGVRLGGNFPWMKYSDKLIDNYSSSVNGQVLGGVFIHLPLNSSGSFSLRPEIGFGTRGQKIDDQGVDYKLSAHYIDLNAAFIFSFLNTASVSPYLFLSPSVGVPYSGKIHYGEMSTDITDGNIAKVHAGINLGLGVTFPVYSGKERILNIGLEAGYYLGLTDNYSDMEKDNTAIALNSPVYEIRGSRKYRDINVSLTASVPLSVFKKKKKEPVIVPVAEVPVYIEPVKVIEEKECYSLEEMKELIRQEIEITGKKICAIDIITFEFGKSSLDRNSRNYLDRIVELMKQIPVSVRINGHTDNVGTPEFNMDLSIKRANAVYDYLISRGIEKSRLSYSGYGLTRPIADNETEEGRAINRRVEFEILNQ